MLAQPMLTHKLACAAAKAGHIICMLHMCQQQPVSQCSYWLLKTGTGVASESLESRHIQVQKALACVGTIAGRAAGPHVGLLQLL